MRDLIIGYSTGVIHKEPSYDKIYDLLNNKVINAIEFSALRENELKRIVDTINSFNIECEYVSVHAPSQIKDEINVIQLLRQIKRPINIVIHPDSIKNWNLWKSFDNNILLENMDKRKPIGRTVEELEHCFNSLPNAGLCFDLGHVQQVDPSGEEASCICKRFGSIIKQLHVSEVDPSSKHVMISGVMFDKFRTISNLLNPVPVIIESPIINVNELTLLSEIFSEK